MAKATSKKINTPQHQQRPGTEKAMKPQPTSDKEEKPLGKMHNKVLLITGGDSGIGKAVAILFAKEGADIALCYLSETTDANDTMEQVEAYGRQCLLLKGDISRESFCKKIVQQTIKVFKKLDVVVNNAGLHYEAKSMDDIDFAKMKKTFEVNVFAMFYITKAALPYMKKGASIINTASVTAYRGSAHLMDYAATKGAIVSFTRSLAANLAHKGIRVNGVAPGPIWTPLVVSSFSKASVEKFGSQTPLQRAGQPVEVAPAYLFLASNDASYITGQFIHPNGGEIING